MPIVQQQEPPTAQVMGMLQQGYSQEQIMSSLQSMGYTQDIIAEALHQANVKSSVEDSPPPPPSPMMQQSVLNEEGYREPSFGPSRPSQPLLQENAPGRDVQEQIQEIVETVIEEKWQRMLEDVGNLAAWKEKVKGDILSIKQEMLRVEARFENLVNAVTGKIKEYDRGMENIGTDIKALEKLLQHLITPLSTNIKELSRITETLKKVKK